MTRTARIVRNVAIGLGILILVLFLTGVMVVRSNWFRSYVEHQIITSVEESTGGTAAMSGLSFEWWRLRAVMTGFVLHGNEPAGAAPFFQAARVEVHLRLFHSLHSVVDVGYLGINKPRANVIVFPDGRTNIPAPRQKTPSNKTTLESVVDAAVGHFELNDGLFVFNDEKRPLNLRGNNLRVQLWFSPLKQAYSGQVSLDPLYVLAGRNTPVNFNVLLPVDIERDRIDFHGAKITSDASELHVSGSLENLRNPKVSLHVNGHVAASDLKNAGNLPLAVNARDVPQAMDVDADIAVENSAIQVTGLQVTAGQSTLEASGTLKDASGKGVLDFKAHLDTGPLGRLAKVSARPQGVVDLKGTARLDQNNNYDVNGNITAHNLSFQQGQQRVKDVNLSSALHLDPHHLDLKGLKLDAFGGEFAGNASLADFRTYQVQGNLSHLDLRAAAQATGMQNLNYDGLVSGPISATGDLKEPGGKGVVARARLSIAPGRHGIPVSGRVNADYNGATGALILNNSFLQLPHSRLNLNGSIGTRMNVSLTTSDLDDLLAALSVKAKPPIQLVGGQATFNGAVTGSLNSPHIAGHLSMTRFAVKGRRFDRLTADLDASKSNVAVSNGVLTRAAMQTQFTASVGLHDWSPESYDPLRVNASIRNGDVADLMAMAGQPSAGYAGALDAEVRLAGTVGNPRGDANVRVSNGTIHGEPVDTVNAQVNFADTLVTLRATVGSPASHLTLNAEYRHPADRFTTGQLRAHVDSNQVNLAQIRSLQQERPGTGGVLQLNADLAGELQEAGSGAQQHSEFHLETVNGDASAHGLVFEGQNFGDATATVRTSGNTVSYNLVSNFAGSNIHAVGNTMLVKGYPTNADATIQNLRIEPLLVAARRTDVPAKGTISGTIHFTGTTDHPLGNADLTLVNGEIRGEPIQNARVQVSYLPDRIELPLLQVSASGARINASGQYLHPAGNLRAGQLRFSVSTNRVDLARLHTVQSLRPGLGGIVQATANGDATVREGAPRFLLHDLNANVAANGIKADGKSFGDLTLVANTRGGRTEFALDSNLAGSSIHGRGHVQLASDYPVSAQLTFANIRWSAIQPLLNANVADASRFEAVADGQATLNGPVLKTDELRGRFEVGRLEFTGTGRPTASVSRVSSPVGPAWSPAAQAGLRSAAITIRNQGPIVVALDRGVIRIDSFHMVGPDTDLQARGTAPLHGGAVDVTVSGKTNLAIIQNFNRDLHTSGSVVLAAKVRGTLAHPLVNGRLELHDATVLSTEYPNGVSNANGIVQFNGTTATIQSFTAESGGGTVTVSGFASYGGLLRFGLRARPRKVRVEVQPGAAIVASANLTLTGTTQASALSGNIRIDAVDYTPQTDLGAMLTRAAPPVQAAQAPNPLLDNMKLDVRVRTAPVTTVQASLAQNLQVDANLQLRGTAAQPGVVGRVTVSQGELVFFGSKYTVNRGVIAFYNPVQIRPVLDVSLETKAKGVDVVVTVSGPIDNMQLSYTSDPPLQFQEIVSLLAAGRTPVTDPTLLANQPSQPPQTFEQMGESALVSKAIADPIASRLQRVFGVSQLKIDPTFVSGQELPQARVTLQQQISSNITFTYVTALNDPNTQIIRIEWSLNPQWSAVGVRDENGIVTLHLFYKKQFR